MNTFNRDNGGKLPAGLTTVTNRTGRPILISPYPQKQKREPIVKVEKHSDWGDGKGAWAWDCRTCAYTGYHPTWELAYATANHHARTQH